MSMKEAYEQKLDAQLAEWKAEIDKLKARAEQADADTRVAYNRQIQDLEAKREATEQRMQELRQASEDAWTDMKAGVEAAFDELSQSVRSAASHFGMSSRS